MECQAGVLTPQPRRSLETPDPFVLLSLVPLAILDHVIVEMSVRVNGRSIVRANFTIYNCSRVGQVYPRTA